ncbi:MAG: beta galactosidase jelly roll domain-containing protein [Bacteroidota bacterium]
MRLAACLLLLSSSLQAQVISLEGNWKFHIDDKSFWSAPDFDDSKWGDIEAPSPWEDQGFNNYDGFAWYRKKFDGRKLDKNEHYYLGLGFIDDCDEVYVNGKLVGFSGSMPPKFKTSYNTEREYNLPSEVINFNGENTIAIRIFDVVHGGGIIEGHLGIFRGKKNKPLLIDLQGIWSFTTSRSGQPVEKNATWDKLMVPGAWDHQGYSRYDGFAWYKKTFPVPKDFTNEPLVLLMGQIDDFDKVYLNGTLVGSTNDHQAIGHSTSYQKDRVYKIPPGLLKKDGINTVEVLVEDIGDIGGFREGPVGVTTMANYERYFHK